MSNWIANGIISAALIVSRMNRSIGNAVSACRACGTQFIISNRPRGVLRT